MKYLLVTLSLFTAGANAAYAPATYEQQYTEGADQYATDTRVIATGAEAKADAAAKKADGINTQLTQSVVDESYARAQGDVAIGNQVQQLQQQMASGAYDGADGKDGAQGLKGDKGDKGDTGAQGVAGRDGIDGHDGITTLRTFHSVDRATQSMVSHDSVRIDALERQQEATDRKIDRNHKEAMHGVASAMAMTGLHYTNDDNSVAIGAGEYASSGAAAMGYRHQFSSHMAAAIQASWDGENSGVAGSVAVGW